jgi:hypothetical protein
MSKKDDIIMTDANAAPEVRVVRRGDTAKQLGVTQEDVKQLDPYALSPEMQEQIRLNTERSQVYQAETMKSQRAREDEETAAERARIDAERKFKAYLDNRVDNILPNLPNDDPIWAYAWVPYEESVNKTDNLRTRLAGGWIPVKWGEIPGFDALVSGGRTASYGEFITFNELVAVKVERTFRNMFLKHYHHDMPNRMEGDLKESIQTSLTHDKHGELAQLGGEFTEMGTERKKPNFNGI